MNIGSKVKIALDETRMLVLGTQILIGFQFRGVFEKLYDQLPEWSRSLYGVALLLIILTFALLILPGPYHRLVEEGNVSGRFHRLIGRVAAIALLPFSVSLGIDVGIAGERVFGLAGGIAAGSFVGAISLLFWFGIEGWQRQKAGQAERAMTEHQIDGVEQQPLHEKIDQMLTEARVILPGSQALLGFQLAIVLTETFEKLPGAVKLTHGAALVFVALSIVLLMAPAAYHRIVYAGEDSETFHCIGGRFVALATVPLALGLAADVFVVATKILSSQAASAVAGVAVLMLLIGFWHALPLLVRRRRQAALPQRARAVASGHPRSGVPTAGRA
jgi:hypothetical protein